tara:strand:+ start:120 stop:548 length:429 start_codon:yes stop_codon:yes gene_type:complete
MESSTNIKKICIANVIDQIFQLFDDVLIVLPNDADILAAKLYTSGIKKVNPKLILSSWHNSVTLKYKTEIDSENIEFALTKNYNEDISKHYNKDSSDFKYFENIIEKIREVVKDLDENNKKKLIKYVQNISNLTEIYYENDK